jgi:hypothetical protein
LIFNKRVENFPSSIDGEMKKIITPSDYFEIIILLPQGDYFFENGTGSVTRQLCIYGFLRKKEYSIV